MPCHSILETPAGTGPIGPGSPHSEPRARAQRAGRCPERPRALPAVVARCLPSALAPVLLLTGVLLLVCAAAGCDESPAASTPSRPGDTSASKMEAVGRSAAPAQTATAQGDSSGTMASPDAPEIPAAASAASPAGVPEGPSLAAAHGSPPAPAAAATAAVPEASDPLVLPHDAPEIDHLAEAQQAFREGRYEAALLAYRRAAYQAKGPKLLRGLAKAAAKLRNRPLAIRAYEEAASLDPTDPEPLIAAARLCIESGEIDRGLKHIDEAIRRAPDRADAHNVRGRLWMAKQQYHKAIDAFEQAIDADPSYVWAYNNLGYVYLVTGRYEAAVENLEIATSLEPVRAYMYNNLGLAYEKLGLLADAEEAYRDALALSPEYVNAKINLSRLETRLAMGPGGAGTAKTP